MIIVINFINNIIVVVTFSCELSSWKVIIVCSNYNTYQNDTNNDDYNNNDNNSDNNNYDKQ